MPVAADNRWPMMTLRGCANGESGKANTIKQLAPNEAINHVSCEAACKYNKTIIAKKAPNPATNMLRTGGLTGAELRKKPELAIFIAFVKCFQNHCYKINGIINL